MHAFFIRGTSCVVLLLQRQTAIMCEAKMFLLLKIVSVGKKCVCWQVSFMLSLTNGMNKQPLTSHRFEKFLESFWKLKSTCFFQVCHIKCIPHIDIQHAHGLQILQFFIYLSKTGLQTVFACFHIRQKNMCFITVIEYSNCDFISHSCIFISHNFYFISHRYKECVFTIATLFLITAVTCLSSCLSLFGYFPVLVNLIDYSMHMFC